MLNVHDEPSLQKESTLTIYAKTTPDGDETSPQKKAPLVKLNGTPDSERNEDSYLKKAPPTKLHEKHAQDKPGRTSTACGATLKDDTRSHQKIKKKASLSKINGTGVLKFLAAFCVLNNVGVAAVGPPAPPSTTTGVATWWRWSSSRDPKRWRSSSNYPGIS